jgi:RimJ/RimL family protein N-acetyltransferase
LLNSDFSSLACPIIDVGTVRLRGHLLTDLVCYRQLLRDSIPNWSAVPHELTLQDCLEALMMNVGHWHLMDFGCWLVETAGSQNVVGEVGFEAQAVEPESAELRWRFSSNKFDAAIARDAIAAALRWSDKRFGQLHFPLKRIVCTIAHENQQALKLLDALDPECFRATGKGTAAITFCRDVKPEIAYSQLARGSNTTKR